MTLQEHIEQLLDEQRIGVREATSICEGQFAVAVAHFEVYLENVFVLYLTGGCPRRVHRRAAVVSQKAALDVIRMGRPYVDWLPYEKWTTPRAEALFAYGKPFCDLNGTQLGLPEDCRLIRNTVAHRGTHATSSFRNRMLSRGPLLPRERTPGGFLRALYRTNPDQTRFHYLLAGLGSVARALTY